MDIQLTDTPTEVREFPRGRFEVFVVGPMTIGRASYDPGWRWSTDVGDEPYVSLHLMGSEDYAT